MLKPSEASLKKMVRPGPDGNVKLQCHFVNASGKAIKSSGSLLVRIANDPTPSPRPHTEETGRPATVGEGPNLNQRPARQAEVIADREQQQRERAFMKANHYKLKNGQQPVDRFGKPFEPWPPKQHEIFDVDAFSLCPKGMTQKKVTERRRQNRLNLRNGERPVHKNGDPFKPWPFPKGATFDFEKFELSGVTAKQKGSSAKKSKRS
jgi:hypothetical protein